MKFEIDVNVGCLTFLVIGEKFADGELWIDEVKIYTREGHAEHIEVDVNKFYEDYGDYVEAAVNEFQSRIFEEVKLCY